MSHREFAEAPPANIGPYRIVRTLGHGGMGFVYEALHVHLRKRVALKLMRRELAADPLQVERFIREGRAACNIHHPHVIDVFEFGFSDAGGPYLVMDYLEGRNLAEHLVEVGRFELDALSSLLLPVLSAVAAAHDAGILHRDLKPSNVMLARDRNGAIVPKVLDFGTSKLLREDDLALTHSAAVIGTPYYMAPEQARSSRDVDARCDQYALGVMLYECATGVRPFEATSSYELMHAIMTAPVTPPSALVPTLSRQFDAVVLRALAREPSARFANVHAFGAALAAWAPSSVQARFADEFGFARSIRAAPAAAGGAGVRTLADGPEPGRPRRASRVLPLALLTALAVLLATVLVTRWRPAGRSIPQTARDLVPPLAAGRVAYSNPAAPSLPPSAANTAAESSPPPALPAADRRDASVAHASPEAIDRSLEHPRRRLRRTVDASPANPPRTPESSAPVPFGDNGAPILE